MFDAAPGGFSPDIQFFVLIDQQGIAQSFINDDLHKGQVPPDAIPITQDIWQAWIADTRGQRWNGQSLEPFTPEMPPAAVPDHVTNFQLRAAMLDQPGTGSQSLFDEVDDHLAAGRSRDAAGRLAWQAWEQSNTVSRSGMLMTLLQAQLKLTDAALDALFLAAAAVKA